MKEKKNLIIILILLVGVVGITLAYFSNSTSIDNLFSTKKYGSTITEEFISPDGWLPGDETSKSIVATNTGEVDQAVRISYTEKWLDSNNNELNGWIHEDGTKSSHTTEEELSSDERVAIINFDNNDDWTYNNGYYYYNYRLQPNESTSSLIKSVSFNSKTKLDDTCTTTISEGKKTITCNSSGDNYDGATYTLTFKIETVQYNKYQEAWSTQFAIAEEKLECKSYNIGDEVIYKGIKYYILSNSNEDGYINLLKSDVLTAEEVNEFSTNYTSINGEYPYCMSTSDCSRSYISYQISDIKKIVDSWADKYVNENYYEVGLIDKIDLGYEYKTIGAMNVLTPPDEIPQWIYLNDKTYWTEIIDCGGMVDGISNNINCVSKMDNYYIRPVVILKKSAIDACSNFDYYYIGEDVIYNDTNYFVIKDSKVSDDYVTLIKQEPLSYNELVTYNNGYEIGRDSVDNNIGTISFYKSDNCYYTDNENYNFNGCSNDYNNSFIRNIVNNWSNSFNNDLVEVNNYKARLITKSELNNLGHTTYRTTDGAPYYSHKSDIKCLYIDSDYWTMNSSSDENYYIDIVSKNNSVNQNVYDQYAIRPVINLKKCAITNTCE